MLVRYHNVIHISTVPTTTSIYIYIDILLVVVIRNSNKNVDNSSMLNTQQENNPTADLQNLPSGRTDAKCYQRVLSAGQWEENHVRKRYPEW